jgi:hypothetical protein
MATNKQTFWGMIESLVNQGLLWQPGMPVKERPLPLRRCLLNDELGCVWKDAYSCPDYGNCEKKYRSLIAQFMEMPLRVVNVFRDAAQSVIMQARRQARENK